MTVAPRQGRDNSKGRIAGRAEYKGKGGERRRCSPCGSQVAARREWLIASTIGSRFVLTPSVRPRSESHGGANGGVAANALDKEEDWQSKGRERENEIERQGKVAGNI
uniref:Uncharacterized protein n=1 Tax=Oryza punctata TaxID=4537 RepID=A0A0E0L0H9_ORYPU